jgi:hypothetical protein
MADWNVECVLRLPHGMPSVPLPSLIVGGQIFFLVQPVLECLDLRRDLKVVLHHLFSSSFTQQLMRDKGESWTVDGLFRALGQPVVLPTTMFAPAAGPITRQNPVVSSTWGQRNSWCLPADLLLDALPGCVATYCNTLHAAASDVPLNVDAHLARVAAAQRAVRLFVHACHQGVCFLLIVSLCFLVPPLPHSFHVCSPLYAQISRFPRLPWPPLRPTTRRPTETPPLPRPLQCPR